MCWHLTIRVSGWIDCLEFHVGKIWKQLLYTLWISDGIKIIVMGCTSTSFKTNKANQYNTMILHSCTTRRMYHHLRMGRDHLLFHRLHMTRWYKFIFQWPSSLQAHCQKHWMCLKQFPLAWLQNGLHTHKGTQVWIICHRVNSCSQDLMGSCLVMITHLHFSAYQNP